MKPALQNLLCKQFHLNWKVIRQFISVGGDKETIEDITTELHDFIDKYFSVKIESKTLENLALLIWDEIGKKGEMH